MRILLTIVATAALSYLAGLILPWWSIAVCSFLIAIIIQQSPLRSILSGFFGIALLWSGLALWTDVLNHSILSQRIANLLPLGGSTWLLILCTALVGGFVGGVSAGAGAGLRPEVQLSMRREHNAASPS